MLDYLPFRIIGERRNSRPARLINEHFLYSTPAGLISEHHLESR